MSENENSNAEKIKAALAAANVASGKGGPVARKATPDAEDDGPRLHAILSNEDVEVARALARKKIDEERRTAAMKQVEAEETERLRIEEGLTTGVREMDELVNITIDLPLFTPNITLNMGAGGIYWHGRMYTVPRHVANTLAEQMHRCWKHDDALDGKSLLQSYGRKRATMINARTGAQTNAPQHFGIETTVRH